MMAVLLFLIIIFVIICYLVWYGVQTVPDRDRMDHAATAKFGVIAANLTYTGSRYEVERTINRWAARLESRSQLLDDELEAELNRQLPAFKCRVIHVQLQVPPPVVQPVERPKNKHVQRELMKVRRKKEAAEALADYAGMSPEQLDIDTKISGYVDQRLRHIFHDPNHV